MKPTLSLLVGLIICCTAHAQIIPDTLRNHRYFPLEVGNEWQYISIGFMSAIPTYQRSKILADTLVQNRQYFKYQSEFLDPSRRLERKKLSWARYNDVGAVLFFQDLEADTVSSDTTTYWYHADFGDTLEVDQREVFVGGTYDTTIAFDGPVYVPVAAVKMLTVPDPLYGTSYYIEQMYAADFGWIYSTVFDGPTTTLHYARIGNVEYGTPAITVAREHENDGPRPSSLVAIYPNPAKDIVTIEYEFLQADPLVLNIYDLLGRCLIRQDLGQHGSGLHRTQLEVSRLSAGAYLVIIAQRKKPASRSVLMIKN